MKKGPPVSRRTSLLGRACESIAIFPPEGSLTEDFVDSPVRQGNHEQIAVRPRVDVCPDAEAGAEEQAFTFGNFKLGKVVGHAIEQARVADDYFAPVAVPFATIVPVIITTVIITLVIIVAGTIVAVVTVLVFTAATIVELESEQSSALEEVPRGADYQVVRVQHLRGAEKASR